MPQIPADKTFFTFAGGINTEVSPLSFPDGVSLTEQNMELLLNGARRRRKGLRREEGQDPLTFATTPGASSEFNSFIWRNVSGDPSLTLIVVQIADTLYFYEDGEVISENLIGQVQITGYDTSAGTEVTGNYPFVFASNDKHLFVTSRYTEPVYIEYDAAAGSFTLTAIDIRIRDFVGIQDGIPLTTEPTTLPADHRYNLQNRGWTDTEIGDYFSDIGRYPSKVQIPFAGYRRATATGYADLDGTIEWNSQKLEAEVFGNTSAPQGHFIQNPFDTSDGFTESESTTALEIVDWTFVDNGATWTVTVETGSAHGFAPTDTVTISGNLFRYLYVAPPMIINEYDASLDGDYTITATPSAVLFTFVFEEPPNYTTLAEKVSNGVCDINVVTFNPSSAFSTTERPKACAFFASRIFYAGVSASTLADKVYFTQILREPDQYGRCYQEADPTSPKISELVATDGGVIQVPGLGDAMKMVPFGSSLFIFARNGVWEIGPSGEGYFAATGFSIRKVTDVEALDPNGIVATDFGIVFTSPRGIFALVQDSNSGFWTAQNMSEQTIQTLWNSIPDDQQKWTMVRYDEAKKRVYFLFRDTVSANKRHYEKGLVYDLRLSAFYKLLFPYATDNHIIGFATIDSGDSSEANNKLKWWVLRTDGEYEICDLNHSDFTEFDGSTSEWELVTGYDNVGDFQRFRQAPFIHVFMGKTETGFFLDGEGSLTPIGESEVYFQALWDWADHPNSGKYGSQYQIYRHRRAYIPEDSSDTFDDGHPVVVSKLKVRGRGRSLHLRFSGNGDKDAYLLGWAIHYRGGRRL